MKAERWKQIDELFDACLELPEDEREEFLSEKSGGDNDLKAEVLSLLKAQTESEKFMENSAMRIAAKNLADEKTSHITAFRENQQIGTYKIERLLGAGGMGEVYLAEDEKLKRKVALKILPAEFLTDEERVKRFEREARMISTLNHPYIVTIYDFGIANGTNYIATEYVEGKTVRELLDEKIELKKTLAIVSQMCEALAAAHNTGIVHRDIKPENIMIRPDGIVKLLDFGLAKLTQQPATRQSFSNFTMKGVIIGTPAYMSPEQVSDDRVDHRTDLWSVGVVLYEMLTGVNPFKGENRQATFQKILAEEPPPVSELNPNVPPELDRILEKALEKDADVSYQTASDLRADLKRVRREIDSSSSLRSSGASAQSRKDAKTRRNYFVYALSLAVLILIGFVIWFAASRFRQDSVSAIDWTKATKIQLTDQPGTEFHPSISPDGKNFVYSARTGGNYDLFLQRTGGKNARNLTEDSTANETQPAFSPDGERIAFRSEREPAGIYVMGATGENVRRICDFGYHPSWSPDGHEIAVTTSGRDLPNTRNAVPSELFIVNAETGEKRLLSKMDAMHPAWSPDGRFIAFWFYPPSVGRRDIAIISKDGGEPSTITKDGTTNWNPVWSPDGKFLYFASDRGGNMSFWRVSIDETGKPASEPEAVVTPSIYSRHLAFSRDGKRLIYVSTNNKSNIQAVEFDPKTEKIIGEPFWVTKGDREVSRPRLSPDGKQFVYRLPRRTQDDVVLINRDGTNQRDLTNDAAFDRYPQWSPDGKRIAFTSDRSGFYEIWTIDADGTNLRQITFHQKDGSSFPIWSPDGTRILYQCAPDNCIIDLNKSWSEQTPVLLPQYPDGIFVGWDWSPDGKRIVGRFSPSDKFGYYSLTENRFEILGGMDEFPTWLSDSRRIIYGLNNKIVIIDAETKRSREIGVRPSENIASIGISRDGKLVYYTLASSESDIWLLDASQNQ